MGASEKDRYILTKKSGDRIIAFTDQGYLTTWNLVTGKHVCTHFKEEVQNSLSDYTVHSKYQNVCIMGSNTLVDSIKDE